ncbi:hypothetical protein JQ612_25245 [Bradyrhizobium manausense]|uniref:hypothetical protein n=1 Tax=Bradyrhizobium manausense TaxID=989370 RepID=UPI001BAD8294|nr:hypothetical protein [Bradyrhizobium manausense]MBR0836507.1 hypothetical protein [Bradyrhizobium manausense]
MAIKKQEFYEGAALHLIIRSGRVKSIRYDPPFFFLNERLTVLLKYSTKVRSPWGFTFTQDEQRQLSFMSLRQQTVIGLVCGSDGIVALPYESYLTVVSMRAASAHVSCYRDHGEHYEVSGPDGLLKRKVAPSSWQRILEDGVGNEAQRASPETSAQADRE